MARLFHAGLLLVLLALPGLPSGADARAADPHFPVPPAEAEQRLAGGDFEVVSVRPAPAGVGGAKHLRLRFASDGLELDAKWKAAPRRRAEGFNNQPRKEIAAYAVQKWFLEPPDFVVPPTVGRCIALDAYAPIAADPEPTLAGTRCVFGALSLWLTDVRPVDTLFDDARAARDPEYAMALARVNLLGYLIAHHDGRAANFLVSTEGEPVHLFSIDNGIAFGGLIYNYFVRNPSTLHVHVLPREAVAALRRLRFEDAAGLGVLEELRVDDRGVLVEVPPGPNLDPEKGTRIAPGRLQLGLTRKEIDGVWKRTRALLRDVDSGELTVR